MAFFEGNDFDDNRMGGIFEIKDGELVKTLPTEETSNKMKYYNRQTRVQNFPGYRFMVGHSHLVNFLRMKYAAYLKHRFLSTWKSEKTGNSNQSRRTIHEDDWRLTIQILKRWNEDCRKISSIPLILYIPDMNTVRSHTASISAHYRTNRRMSDFAKANHILFVNLADPFRRNHSVKNLYLPDGHLSPRGHRVVADKIARFLKKSKIG